MDKAPTYEQPKRPEPGSPEYWADMEAEVSKLEVSEFGELTLEEAKNKLDELNQGLSEGESKWRFADSLELSHIYMLQYNSPKANEIEKKSFVVGFQGHTWVKHGENLGLAYEVGFRSNIGFEESETNKDKKSMTYFVRERAE